MASIREEDPDGLVRVGDHDVTAASRVKHQPRKARGGAKYSLVSSEGEETYENEGDDSAMDEDDVGESARGEDTDQIQAAETPLWQRILHYNLIPDQGSWTSGSCQNGFELVLLDGPEAMRLLKFAVITFLGIAFMYNLVRILNWEHDDSLKLSDVWLYEGNLITLDLVSYYLVGRLYRQRGVDHLAWMGWALAANVYSSYITTFSFLQHSLTLYEMHCTWPVTLWVFVLFVTPLVITIAWLHVHHAVQQGKFLQKLVEILICFSFVLFPLMTSPYFHLHHWFAGWLIGMHCNADVWWSRAVMAWCWGVYMNGIAVYGRDPVLTCGYAYWISVDNRCPYMKCYLDAMEEQSHPSLYNHTNSSHPHVDPMLPPDWRNCSASSYHG